MNDIKIDGIGTIEGGAYGTVRINGVSNCKGKIDAETIRVDGTLQCKGNINASSIRCDGIMNCQGIVATNTLEVNGTAKVGGPVRAHVINITGLLQAQSGQNLEASTIRCTGMLQVGGQISADLLETDGIVKADEIVGDKVLIRSNLKGLHQFLPKNLSKTRLIEATDIELSGVTAETVNGSHIIIGPYCTIDRLDCNGALYIHPDSNVRSITGTYTSILPE